MTFVNPIGFDLSVNEAQWATIMQAHDYMRTWQGVVDGLAVTPTAVARQLRVASGHLILPGLYGTNDANYDMPALGANAGGSDRYDLLVARAEWGPNTITPQVIVGVPAQSLPTLTQTIGDKWDMPMARVRVTPGMGVIPPANIESLAPVRCVMQAKSASSMVDVTRGNNSGAYTVGEVTFADPGWPYYLVIHAQARFGTNSDGGGVLNIQLNGTDWDWTSTGLTALAGRNYATMDRITTAPRTGKTTVGMQIYPTSMGSGSLFFNSGSSYLDVELHPA